MVRIAGVAMALGLIALTACGRDETRRSAAAHGTVVLARSDEAWTLERGIFSPTSPAVAVVGTHDGEDAIGIVEEGAPTPRPLPVAGAHDAAWFPDGKKLLLAVRDDVGERDRLVVVREDGSIVRTVEPDRAVRLEGGFAVAPDSVSAIVSYQKPGLTDTYADLALIDLETGTVRLATHTRDITELHPEFIDDDTVVFSSGALVSEPGARASSIEVLDLQSGEVRTVTPADQVAGTAAVIDTDTLVYDAIAGKGDEPGLWRVQLNGQSSPELVVQRPGRYPSVSPDGSTAVVLEPVFGGSKLVLVDLLDR